MDPGRGGALGEDAATQTGEALSEYLGMTADTVDQNQSLFESESSVDCNLY